MMNKFLRWWPQYSKFVVVQQLVYLVFISTFGFLILKAMPTRTQYNTPRNIDLFFTSVSATTLSSMSTIEMEVFSNNQLIAMIFLMFVGGDVLIFMVELLTRSIKMRNLLVLENSDENKVDNSSKSSSTTAIQGVDDEDHQLMLVDSIKFLGYVVLGYLVIFHILGISLVLLVTNLVSSTKNVLTQKGIKQVTFAIFTIVSTFSNCGFIPINENMFVFQKNSTLLLILIPQILFGNTLFPSCLRFCLWFLAKFFKKEEAHYLLNNSKATGYSHLLPGTDSWLLAATVIGLLLVQFLLFWCLDWDSDALSGLNSFERIVGVLFMCANSRHAGETIVNLSNIAPAILVFFILMMYLPPYTTFVPVNHDEKAVQEDMQKKPNRIVDNLLFSPLTYVAMFVILICITERKSLKDDPLNFNLLNITLEVVSAYGNVGFSSGYSCEHQLKVAADNQTCVEKWYGFAGKWTDGGKLLLIIVMLFGRLKKHLLGGGKSWKLI